jgi:small subunit ribosomal protein S1
MSQLEDNNSKREESKDFSPEQPDSVSANQPGDQESHCPAPRQPQEPPRNDAGAAEPSADIPAQQPPPKPVEPPGVDYDIELEHEIEEALGDISLIDVYDFDELEDPQESIETVDASAETYQRPLKETKTQAAPAKPKPSARERRPVKSPNEPFVHNINRGKVIGVSNDGVFVDLGGKSQGFLPKEEYDEGETIEVGTEINVAIVRYDSHDGLLILSRKTAEQQLLRKNLTEGSRVEARVTGSNKGGLELDIKGLKAFMPTSQIDIARVEKIDSLIGERFVCEVMQVERGDKNIVLSRRNVLLQERAEHTEKLWDEIEEGQSRSGVVRSLADYGAFVDLGGVDGLLHVSELSWARVKHPKDILQVGQTIDVMVISVDREKQRISLSLRKAGCDPWTTAEQKYGLGTRHQAQITKIMNFGAFAELEAGVEGLIPISEMTWAGRIRHPSDVVTPGMMVEVEILKLDVGKRRISMSMKSIQENPWANVSEKYANNDVCTGKVSRVTDFGAFVTLESGVDGLLHISEMSDKRVEKATDVVSEGQEIQVRIVNIDLDSQRIALSLKDLPSAEGTPETGTPQENAAEQAEPPSSDKKKKQRPLRGGLSW